MSPICPSLDPLEQLLAGAAVADHQADADLQVLLLRRFAEFQHPPGGGTVHRHRLLHEDVQALVDGVAELHPAEGGRRREDRDVAGLEAIDRFSVGVEADELAVLRDVHLRRRIAAAAGRGCRRAWRGRRRPWRRA